MTGLEVAEERERDASRQRRQDERSAAALAAANHRIEVRERERREEEEILAANWVADTQLQFSQLSYDDPEADNDQPTSPSPSPSRWSSPELSNNQLPVAEPGSQAQPLVVSSDNETSGISDSDGDSNGEPRRSGRVKRRTVVMEPQQWQIEHGLISAPGARGKARALNVK
jgi:hypothetical protein